MRWALHILGLVALLTVASWSFSVTYRTKDMLDGVARLNRDIAVEREALAVLTAEWAWLSAPDRLAALSAAQGDVLGLEPLTPERFGEVAEVPLIEQDDGMDPVALIDLDALSPTEDAPRRRAAAADPGLTSRIEPSQTAGRAGPPLAPPLAPARADPVAPTPLPAVAAPSPVVEPVRRRSEPARVFERIER